jgi:molybdopterin synthase catalytic subunit
MIRIQEHPFDVSYELQLMKSACTAIGGTVLFVGSVRDMNEGHEVSELTLEHYPGMTEKALMDIETEAQRRWPLKGSLIVHRYGKMRLGEDIVLVIATSAHREAAFEACHFLIDWLKTKAPFWKLEAGASGALWVDAKASDDNAAARWRE